MERIVLAYSGGLHASVAIPWLADTHRAAHNDQPVNLGRLRPCASGACGVERSHRAAGRCKRRLEAAQPLVRHVLNDQEMRHGFRKAKRGA